ncbi:SRPBCC family protein [Leptospira brenneri]|uniref:SRPBCC domain-containing protein n=1 Tax=Leptospira brenneri TaxID=2023182 RepID=A0A2M9Y0R3_9LEPT|nr:SRPBCC domain-containing protein [Leptospira brenneri]PJZ45167.1 ATPase [Leptospira brenneri]TGK94039.1 SRPBCC domain-containing protein [Leptospira brenneri]
MKPEVLRIEKEINADPIKIFRAWLNAEDFALWFLSGEGIEIESVIMDPRPGGKFIINMELDGKILPHEGEYITIDEPNKLVFTWRSHATDNKDTLVTITFEEIKDIISKSGKVGKQKTLVTLVHEELTSEIQVKMHNHGWTNILEGLDQWINSGK